MFWVISTKHPASWTFHYRTTRSTTHVIQSIHPASLKITVLDNQITRSPLHVLLSLNQPLKISQINSQITTARPRIPSPSPLQNITSRQPYHHCIFLYPEPPQDIASGQPDHYWLSSYSYTQPLKISLVDNQITTGCPPIPTPSPLKISLVDNQITIDYLPIPTPSPSKYR